MTKPPTPSSCDAGRWLRAVRRARSLSQRELAELADVPLSTISAVESGRRRPGIDVFARILAAAGHRLDVVDTGTGECLATDDEHDQLRDSGGRRLPAHLEWGGRPSMDENPSWWGWHRIVWYDDRDPRIPDHTFRQRPREARGPLREHPWFGQFRGRGGCFGPTALPCEDCVGDCRYGGEAG